MWLRELYKRAGRKRRKRQPRSSVPGGDFADHVPDEIVEGKAHVGAARGTGVGESGPAEAGVRADHDGGGAGEAAVVPPIGDFVDGPAAGVGEGGGARRGHGFDGIGLEQARSGLEEVIEEKDEFAGRGEPTAVRVHAGDVHVVGIFAALAVVDDFVGKALCESVAGDAHIANAAVGKNGFVNEIGVGTAGEVFDDAAEDAVAEIRISVVRAGRMLEGLRVERPGDKLGVIHLRIFEHGVVVGIVPAAAGVGEELIDGDVFDPFFVGSVAVSGAEDGAGAEDAVVLREFAAFDEDEDGGGSDGFGDAGDAEEMIGSDALAGFAIGKAEGGFVSEAAVVGDSDGESGDVELAHEIVGAAGHAFVFGRGGLVFGLGNRIGEGGENSWRDAGGGAGEQRF